MSANLTNDLKMSVDVKSNSGGDSLWAEAFRRLLKDKVAVAGGLTIILLIFVALFASFLAPHDPNKQYTNGTSAYGMPFPIGGHSKLMTLELAEPAAKDTTIPNSVLYLDVQNNSNEFKTRQDIEIAKGQKSVQIPVNPIQAHLSKVTKELQLKPEKDLAVKVSKITVTIDQSFPLGTDSSGRDVLSRLIYGSQVSLKVGVIAMGLAAIIGCVLGLISGFYGGWVDMIIMRFTDIMMSFPDLLLVMAIVAIKGPSLGVIYTAIAVVSWTSFARIIRSQVLTVREMEFVEASKAIGAKDTYIIFRHILPNVIAPVIVLATMGIAGAIMTEAGLSFLGFGVKAPTASWGSMINEGLGFFRDMPLIPLVPGFVIAVTVFAFNLFGDGLRDALDPRLK